MKPILTLLLGISALQAQTGHWEGVIQLPAGEIPIQIDLAHNPANQLYGSFSSPAQQLVDFPLSDLGMKGREVFFQIKGTPGNRAFIGSLSPDSKSMTGEFKQGQFTLRFVLTKVGEPRIAAVPKLTAISKELEGSWNGTGQETQFVLTLANQADGTATATIHTLADDLEIPVSALEQTSSNIALELHAIGGTITATLNGPELSGTFTQGSTTFPVSFRKNPPHGI